MKFLPKYMSCDVPASKIVCMTTSQISSENEENEDIKKLKDSSGIFSSGSGFLPALPSSAMGFHLFHYNWDHPPDFKLGGRNVLTIKEPLVSRVVKNDDKSSNITLIAPPLPDWNVKVNSNPVKKPFVRSKTLEKNDKEPVVATGWQAIMAEMNRRKEGTLKKVEIESVKVVAPSSRPKTKKKKGKDFKDIMEELSYKLAKLRGEVESDGEDAEETASEQKKEIKTVVSESMTNSTVGVRKLTSKPDLSSLLAKIKSPIPLVEKVGLIDAEPSSKIPVTFVTALSIPKPPIVPSLWPPIAHFVSTNDSDIFSSIVPNPSNDEVETHHVAPVAEYEMTFYPLSSGFYTPQPKFDLCLIPHGDALHVGVVDVAFCDNFIKNTTESAVMMLVDQKDVSDSSSSITSDRFELQSKYKLTTNDLPLPANYCLTVERLQKSNALRSERIAKEKTMELRNYNLYSKTRSKFKISEKLEISFAMDGRAEQKTHSFRKLDVQINLPLSHRVNNCSSTDIWMNSLRRTDLESNVESCGMSQYKSKFRVKTESAPPSFFTDGVVSRRQAAATRQNYDDAARNAEERKALLDNKEFLKQRAISAAKSAGVYKPITRLHQHNKLLSKYSNRVDVSADLRGAAVFVSSNLCSSFECKMDNFDDRIKRGEQISHQNNRIDKIDSYKDVQTKYIF
jgi:gas vesicle protein